LKSPLFIRQEHRLTDILTYTKPPIYRPSKKVYFFGENFASAVEIKGNRLAMNSADFIPIGAVSYVATLHAMSTYFLSVIWN